MQKLDDHDLDVIMQVRKFGERFDHPFLSAALESLAGARLESLFLHAPH